jgi:hypothetical protein
VLRRIHAAALIAASTLLPLIVQAADSPALTREEQEQFLRSAKILKRETLSVGTTNSQKATLGDGQITHDAHVQTIDIHKPRYETAGGVELNFRDTYKFNIAAYRLDKLLGLNMVPVTVERKVAGQTAAVAWWVDDVLMMEKDRYLKGIEPPDQEAWNRQIYQARAFQQLIANSDPNLGNFIITKDWKLWTVDFTRAFRSHKDVATRELNCIDPRTHEALKKLDKRILERELGSFLGNWEMEGLLARRDKIVEFFERKAAEQGKEKAFCAVRAGLVVNNEHQAL